LLAPHVRGVAPSSPVLFCWKIHYYYLRFSYTPTPPPLLTNATQIDKEYENLQKDMEHLENKVALINKDPAKRISSKVRLFTEINPWSML
jgi:hypothetical protein